MNLIYRFSRAAKAVLAAGLVISLAACAQDTGSGGTSAAVSSAEGSAEKEGFVTLGDAMKADTKNAMMNYTDDRFVYAFEYEGKTMRVIAEITKEIHDQLDAIPLNDNDRDEKILKIVSDLKIIQTDDFSSVIPTAEDLEALKGKKGQELLDQGYVVQGIGVDEEGQISFVIDNGLCQLNVMTEEAEELPEHPDEAAIFGNSTIKSAEFVTMTWDITDPSVKPQ